MFGSIDTLSNIGGKPIVLIKLHHIFPFFITKDHCPPKYLGEGGVWNFFFLSSTVSSTISANLINILKYCTC